MVPKQIGKWLVTEHGIEWTGINDYFIEKERLLEAGPADRINMYDWLVHLPEKSWLSVEDIYALNTAFIFALDYFGFNFNSRSFVTTLIEQEQHLDLKRNE